MCIELHCPKQRALRVEIVAMVDQLRKSGQLKSTVEVVDEARTEYQRSQFSRLFEIQQSV